MTTARLRERGRLRARPSPSIPRSAFVRRDARRSENRAGVALLAELHCECGRPDCRATIPAGAGVHRRRPEQFIVVPDHLAGETVVAAADRFFVVQQGVRSSL